MHVRQAHSLQLLLQLIFQAFLVEEWFERDRYETLAICRQLAYARGGDLREARWPVPDPDTDTSGKAVA